jgi:putative transcriptional regulator
MESIQGKALVASPYLMDPNFLRSVVYIHRHNDEGAIGLILNRPMTMTVGDLLEQLLDSPIQSTSHVYTGGPVEGPLMLLHDQAHDEAELNLDVDEEEIANEAGICLTTDQAKIVSFCKNADQRFRVFDGYSGWSPGQLEKEMQGGGWLVWNITPDDIFSNEEEIWEKAIRQIGRDILSTRIHPSRIPDDPAYN